jgi:putative peptidoglycan lipid II flippase
MKRLYSLVGLVGALTLAGSVLGYVRNASIASVFGLSGDSDAYFVAIFIPNTLQVVLVLGALAPALVHVYVNYIEEGRPDDARVTFSSVLNFIAIAVGLLVLLGLLFSRSLVGVIAPGLSGDSAELSAGLMSFTLPLLLLLCLAALIGPILNTKDHFFTPALNSFIINACTVAFVVIAGSKMGVEAAAVGILTGGVLHVGLLLIFLRRKGIAYSPILRLGHPGVRRVLKKSAPVMLYMGIAYSAPLLDRLLASLVMEGAVTIVTIAFTVFALPTIVFNGSLGIVLYPQLVRDAATDRDRYERTLAQASRVVLAVLIPVTVLMMAASVPLMRLAYGPGEVASADVHTGAAVLAVYVIALSAVGLTQILQRAIYADGDFVTPLKVELMTLGLYAAAAITLSHVWALVGLALARAGHHVIAMFLTFWMVRRLPEVPSLRRLGRFALRPLLASAAAVAFYGTVFLAVDRAYPSPSYVLMAVEQAALLLTAGGVYLMAASFLRVEEVRVLWRLIPVARSRPAVTQEAA